MVHDFKCHEFFIYFSFSMPCLEPLMGMSSVVSFSVWSRGSLTMFPMPLGIGKLASNREYFYLYVLGVALGFWLI